MGFLKFLCDKTVKNVYESVHRVYGPASAVR